jgi:hypothetical protein
MQLLIDWRLAACQHANRKAYREFSQNYKLDDMRNIVSTGSRGLDAFNWIATLDGRDDRLTDAEFDKRVKEMERMHHISRFFKNSEIKVDLFALAKKAFLSNPKSPIYFDLPQTELLQRDANDPVYSKVSDDPIKTGYSYVTQQVSSKKVGMHALELPFQEAKPKTTLN